LLRGFQKKQNKFNSYNSIQYSCAINSLMYFSFFFSLSLIALTQSSAFAWGEIGHELVVEFGNSKADPKVFKNCETSAAELVQHTNDPDRIWKSQRGRYKMEPAAHYFHVDTQDKGWESRSTAKNPRLGFLVYRIIEWVELGKQARKKKNLAELKEKLYGLSHYIGDLVQPLHLHSDHDGKNAGIPGLHAQFETKMIQRYRAEIRHLVSNKIKTAQRPAEWRHLSLNELIFRTATDSSLKAPRLFALSKNALVFNKKKKSAKPRFQKKLLWEHTGTFATDQIVTGGLIWAYILEQVCS